MGNHQKTTHSLKIKLISFDSENSHERFSRDSLNKDL